MPSSFTPLLKLELPATGELSGTWGTTVNNAITTPLSEAIAGTTTITVGGSDYTLSNGDGSAANEARKMFIVATGTPGASRNVICPAASKFYVFRNDTNQTLTLKTLSGTGIAVPAGQYRFLYCNGTDVVETFNAMASLTLGTALGTASGGTGLNSFTANRVFYASSTSAIAQSANLTFNGTTLVANDFTDSSLTATRVTYAGAGGNLTDSANLTFDGTSLALGGSPNLILSSSGIERGRIVTGTGAVELMAGSTTTPTISMASNVATFTNNPVLSGGTANGVLYLDGSKVATSGSALTFDGTKFTQTAGTTGILSEFKNTSSANQNGNIVASNDTGAAVRLQVFGSAAGTFGMVTAGMPLLYTSAADLNIVADNASGAIKFGLSGGAEQMRLTSTGLGIGTSSPQAKLQVLNTIKVSTSDQSSGNVILGDGSSTSFNVGIARWNGSTNAAGAGGMGYFSQGAGNSGGHYFYTGDAAAGSTTLRMTIDTSGNLGLGVTPSAWRSGTPAFQIGSSGVSLFSDSQVAAGLGNNMYLNASSQYIYQRTDAASRYQQYQGTHAWYTAPSGTAGNAISFTQALTLDASGNLGVGTTSPAYRLDVDSGAANTAIFRSTGGNPQITATDGTVTQFAGYTGGGIAYAGTSSAHPFAFVTNNIERARIDSSGNLLVGGTAALYGAAGRGLVQVSGSSQALLGFGTTGNVGLGFLYHTGTNFEITNSQNGYLSFGTNNTERARIPAAGGMVVGTAALATTATDGFLYVPTCAGTPTGTPTTQTGAAPIVVDTTNNKLYFYSGGQWRDAGP